MTKDEAKEFLREFLKDRPNFREEHPGQDEEVYRQMDRLTEALDMAIDALGKDTDVPSSNLISRQAAIDVLSLGKEILSRVLDDMDVVGTDRDKYSWGLGLIESNINDIEELPSAQPEIIRCKDCKHRHIENMVWTCPFGLPGGELFFCAYGAERRTDG